MSTPGGLSWQGGWDEPGVLSLVIIETGIPGSGLFLYNGVPGVGTLLASVTESTTDPFGNTTQPGGFVVYLGSAYAEIHVSSHGAPAFEMVTGVASEAQHAVLYTFPNNVGLVNEIIGTFLIGPGSSFDVGGFQAAINLASSAADGSELAVGTLGTISSGAFTNIATWDATGFHVINLPDSVSYTVGHLVLNASATTINLTTGIPITGLTTNVGIGSYYIRCMLRCQAAASGVTQQMAPRLSGTATPLGTWRIFTNAYVEASGSTVNPGNISGYNVDPGVLTGAVPNNTVFDWTLEGIVTFSAAGTLLVQGRQVTSAASETFTVQAGSFLTVEPV